MAFNFKKLFNPKSLLGNVLLSPLGQMAGKQVFGEEKPKGPAPFTPTRQSQQELPSSFQGFGALNPAQQASNIATQGVYGGGLGPQEQSYFLNLVNRQLIDETGKTSQDLSSLSPIQSSYLSNLGLGGYNNPKNLLEAISKWKAS